MGIKRDYEEEVPPFIWSSVRYEDEGVIFCQYVLSMKTLLGMS